MREVVVAGVVRTPIGSFGGGLTPLSAVDLGVLSARETIRRADQDPREIDETLFGHGRQAGGGRAANGQKKTDVPEDDGLVARHQRRLGAGGTSRQSRERERRRKRRRAGDCYTEKDEGKERETIHPESRQRRGTF